MNNARAVLIVIGLTIVGTSHAMALESGPPLPVVDRMFIIDRSGSIDLATITLELDLVNEFICGPQALDPTTTPFGLSVILFNSTPFVLIPYTVVSSQAQAEALCAQVTSLTTTSGGSRLHAALDEAIVMFQSESLASDRRLAIFTDGSVDNPQLSLDKANTLRTMFPPVRICTMDVSDDCSFDALGAQISNTIESSGHDPSQPTGLHGCVPVLHLSNMLCDDCICDSDCNANGVLDSLDILDGTSLDLNGDRLPDECVDCDQNQIYDASEIANGTAPDCNGNGVLDQCDALDINIDCDQNAIPDTCEIADGTAPDCNENNVHDRCDLISTIQSFNSPQFSPFGLGFEASYTIISPPPAIGDVRIEFLAIADLGGSVKYMDISINGTYYGRLLNDAATTDCPLVPEWDQLVIPMAEYNALLVTGAGDLTLDLVADSSLPFDCNGSPPWVSMSVNYLSGPSTEDINNNEQPDECDLANGDNNLDGIIDVEDLLNLLAKWGQCAAPCPEDTNLDGTVDVEDLLTLLANWG
ncbi:MAG: VWA domain-containing protein [Planctomycetota bacterium]|nr:VWA domain-containing protein [Planctomycetota bacterium]